MKPMLGGRALRLLVRSYGSDTVRALRGMREQAVRDTGQDCGVRRAVAALARAHRRASGGRPGTPWITVRCDQCGGEFLFTPSCVLIGQHGAPHHLCTGECREQWKHNQN